jgi:predicted murein hydrolase (TIGR00659 family)
MMAVYMLMTVGVFLMLRKLLSRFTHPLANPLLWSITFFITLFSLSSLNFEQYEAATQPLVWLLEPAVVALAIPLFTQFQQLKQHLNSIFICCLVGVLTALISGTTVAMLLTNDKPLLLSLLPKSVTTPIAMDISQQTGGIAALTAGVVIFVGIGGAMIGMKVLTIFNITNPQAQGLAMGCSAHAVGTATAIEAGETQGAFSSFALVLCAIITAILAPFFAWVIHML